MTNTPVRNTSGTKRSATGSRTGQQNLSVLLYSDDVDTRTNVTLAVGRRPAPDLPVVEWTECATAPAVLEAVQRGGIDLLVLDGEARPMGGMGLCKQLKDEIRDCPPVLLLTGRPDDAWLATWSMADQAVPKPLDPIAVADAVAQLARRVLGETADDRSGRTASSGGSAGTA
jgi:DNA-binding response OmpR family regulator